MRLVGYGYTIPTADQLTQIDELNTGALRMATGSNPQLVLASGVSSMNSFYGIVDACHDAGKKCSVQLYSPWPDTSYNQVFTNSALRQDFFANIRGVLSTYNFDGVNFDWESDDYAASADIVNFYKELRQYLGTGVLISAVENYRKQRFNAEAGAYLDWAGPMTYDVAPAETWYCTLSQMQGEANRWAAGGFPKAKTVCGITFAARPVWSAWYSGQPYHDTPAGAAQKTDWLEANGFNGVFCYQLGLDKPDGMLKAIYDAMPHDVPPDPPDPPVPPPCPHTFLKCAECGVTWARTGG